MCLNWNTVRVLVLSTLVLGYYSSTSRLRFLTRHSPVDVLLAFLAGAPFVATVHGCRRRRRRRRRREVRCRCHRRRR